MIIVSELKISICEKFMKRFDRGANRERIDNLSREFKEELIDKKYCELEPYIVSLLW